MLSKVLLLLEPACVDLGRCCACGRVGLDVRVLVYLDRLAPMPGTGWGCFQCGLQADGAVAVVCDGCARAGSPPREAIRGPVLGGGRVPVESLGGPYGHRMHLHPGSIPRG